VIIFCHERLSNGIHTSIPRNVARGHACGCQALDGRRDACPTGNSRRPCAISRPPAEAPGRRGEAEGGNFAREWGEWARMLGGLTSVSAQVSGANAPSQGMWLGVMPAVASHSMAGGTPALRGILGGPAPRRENIPRPSFAASGLKNRTAAGFLLPEKTSRRRHRVAPGLFDPWDHPCHTPQCFMAAGLQFPVGHFIPLQEPLWTLLPELAAAIPCKFCIYPESSRINHRGHREHRGCMN